MKLKNEEKNLHLIIIDQGKKQYDLFQLKNPNTKYFVSNDRKYRIDISKTYVYRGWNIQNKIEILPHKILFKLFKWLSKGMNSYILFYWKDEEEPISKYFYSEKDSPILTETYVLSRNMQKWFNKNIYGRQISTKVWLYLIIAFVIIILIYYFALG